MEPPGRGRVHVGERDEPGPQPGVDARQRQGGRPGGATILSEESARVSESSNEALDWAFTWRLNEGASSDWASPGVVYHETRRFIAVGDEAAVLTWVVPADEWRKLPDMARGVFDTFEISGDIS
nr:hypothetical protein GCM10020093_045670 [Planobispora longispora]